MKTGQLSVLPTSVCSDDAFKASPVYMAQTQEPYVSSDQDIWRDSDIDSMDKQEQVNFIDKKNTARHLPIPGPSDLNPHNTYQFLTHFILSLGKYDTEVDVLTHGSFRNALRSTNLIGGSDDVESLKDYSRKLTRLYVGDKLFISHAHCLG